MVNILIIILSLSLALITFQDYRYRAVSWFLFPIAALALFFINFHNVSFEQILVNQLSNLGFLCLQFLILLLFFRVRNISSQDILKKQIGLGDVLFFIVLALGLPTTLFILFFVGSLIVSLAAGLILFSKSTVPLAGLQSAMLLVLITLNFLGVINMYAITLPTFI